MKKRTASIWLLSVALALGLAACGGDEESKAEAQKDDDAGQVEAVAERFDRIVAAKDTEAFCEILAPSSVQRLGGGETDGRKECLAVWGRARNPLFKASDPDLTVAEITKYEPPYVTARLNNGGKLVFLREGGTWYVTVAPQR